MVLILSRLDVQKVLNIRDSINVVEEAFKELALGNIWMPPRQSTNIEEYEGWVGIMPGYIRGMNAMGTKIVTEFRRNSTQYNLPTIMATIIVNDPKTGTPIAIMDGSTITAMRTGAAGGVAAKHLAREDSHIVGIFGAGVQSRTQLSALCEIRPILKARVYDVMGKQVNDYVKEMSKKMGIDIKICDNPEDVVSGSDVIITASTSNNPVFKAEWLEEGTHINAVGAHSPNTREIDTETVRSSKFVVDSLETANKEAGEFIIPLSENAITKNHIYGEIGEIIAGIKPGRVSKSERTIFKTCGLSIQDVSTARLVYTKAKEAGIGREVEIF